MKLVDAIKVSWSHDTLTKEQIDKVYQLLTAKGYEVDRVGPFNGFHTEPIGDVAERLADTVLDVFWRLGVAVDVREERIRRVAK